MTPQEQSTPETPKQIYDTFIKASLYLGDMTSVMQASGARDARMDAQQVLLDAARELLKAMPDVEGER